MRSIGGIIYIVIGVVIAASKGYLGDVNGFGDIINLLLAILLWPLVLFGVKFNLRLGGGGDNKDGKALRAEALLLFGPPVAFAEATVRRWGRRS